MPPDDKKIFSSDIPQYLLANASPETKWIMENISKLTQQSDYVLDEQIKQNLKLTVIEDQCNHINGTVKEHTRKLDFFENMKSDLVDLVTTKKTVEKVFASKWFWFSSIAFIVGVVKICTDPVLREFLSKLL